MPGERSPSHSLGGEAAHLHPPGAVELPVEVGVWETNGGEVNSRLDTSFGFENHTIRRLEKMKLRCGLALCVMLAMALGRIRTKEPERMRSLVA